MDCDSPNCPNEATHFDQVANLCQAHYMAWRRYGYVGTRFPRKCTVEGCNAKHTSGGYCSKHYRLMRETGSTDDVPRKNARKKCTVEGCDEWRVGWGLCRLHYERQRAINRPPVLYEGRICGWCEGPIPATKPGDAIFCSAKCKQYSSNEKGRQSPEAKERQRASNLKRAFNITIEEWEALYVAQGGCCAICHRPDARGRGRLHVDHDHASGRVRGLLCTNCNNGLGRFQDDPVLLASAIDYLSAAPS